MAFVPSDANADALATALESIVANPDTLEWFRKHQSQGRLRECGRKLSVALETRGDTVHRIANTPLQLALARVGVEKGVFQNLAKYSALSNADLAAKTGISPALMKRLLRYYQSFDMISQPQDDIYKSNNVTKALASPTGESGINYFAEMISPSFAALPRYLRANGYEDVTDPSSCPWHMGHNTSMSPFEWLNTHPDHMAYFLPWMGLKIEGLPIFLDALDFQQEFAQNTNESTPVFVDVGGAMGHKAIAVKQRFKQRCPELIGRIILQDRPEVIEQVKAQPLPGFDGIEAQAYDFTTPQPVQGARAYYFCNIFHDWPDEMCKTILENVKAAMTEDSVVLIDEMVLSERGAPWRATQLDMAMLTCLAAKERTEAEWRALLDEAGFKILKIVKYTEECEDCVIVVVPK
ncbi:putative sterigmatocystin 8-O-methyltransferase precursor [Xylariomycetidae sp. FL0641]|nr:putative sterigmatocystin 8-O-methyltransferase precursor [Xylariomycetidae sp. FL0641]